MIEKGELVYRISFAYGYAVSGNYVIAEPRDTASTGELVVALFEGKIYVGRWWMKHGARELILDEAIDPLRGVTILGVINQIIRLNRA